MDLRLSLIAFASVTVIGVSQGFAEHRRRSQPASVSFVARVANWDADLAADGWEIEVYLKDPYGFPVPLKRNYSATFYWRPMGVSLSSNPPAHFGKLSVPEQATMQWTVPLTGDLGPIRLPFRPGSSLDSVSGAGLLTVRVSVPTIGILESGVILDNPLQILVDKDRNYR